MSLKQKYKIRKNDLIYLYVLKTLLLNKRKEHLDFYTTDIFFSYDEFDSCVFKDRKIILDKFNMLIDKIDFTRSKAKTDYYDGFISQEKSIPGLYYLDTRWDFEIDSQEVVSIIFGNDITVDDINRLQENYKIQKRKLIEEIQVLRYNNEGMGLATSDAVWLSTALLTYNYYYLRRYNDFRKYQIDKKDIVKAAMYLNADDTRGKYNIMAQKQCVANAAVSKCGKNNYLVCTSTNNCRRLAFESEYPFYKPDYSAFDMHKECITINGRKTVGDIIDFINRSYYKHATAKSLNRDYNEWIFPCNPRIFRLDELIQDGRKQMTWKKMYKNIEVGDIVYIYMGIPFQEIKYKFEVIKDGLKNRDVADRKYIGKDSNNQAKEYVRLKLIAIASDQENKKCKYDDLLQHGYSSMQKAVLLKNSSKEIIDKAFK